MLISPIYYLNLFIETVIYDFQKNYKYIKTKKFLQNNCNNIIYFVFITGNIILLVNF